jgi:AcrR family transcriptional regulator
MTKDNLPPGVAAAWGLRPRQGKGPKPGLSRERILEAAVAVAASEGLQAVSMPRVAKELGTAPMSLYRHVESKDELLALMRDAALGPPPELAPGDWREGLAEWARGFLNAMRANMWAVRIPIAGLPIMPNELAWTERALRALGDTGLAQADRISVLLSVSTYVRGMALIESELTASVAERFGSLDDLMGTYTGLLRRITDEENFPAFTAVIRAGVLDKADPPDAEFEFGLNRILDGIAHLIEAGG